MIMIRKALWILLLAGYVAMVWHGVTGDAGPMGWLNALQQHWTGGYSRKLSFLVFSFGVIALSSPILLPLILSAPAATPAEAPPVKAPEIAAQPISKWKAGLLGWGIPVMLAWVATFGYYGWEGHVRSQDASQPYEPVSLASGAPPASVSGSSRLALQGRFLWDRTVVRSERGMTESTYVPVVDLSWHEGESSRFVAQFDSRELPAWRAADKARRGPILARVEGAAPTAAFDVFAKMGAPLAPSAALIVPVASADGRPAQPQPAFDLEQALLLSTVLTAVWTACALALALGLAKEAWSERRRARRAAQGLADGPRNWVWIGGRFHRKQTSRWPRK